MLFTRGKFTCVQNYATMEIHLNTLHYSSFLLLTEENLNPVTRQGGYPLSRNFHGRTGVRTLI